jgi:hypothetical protein
MVRMGAVTIGVALFLVAERGSAQTLTEQIRVQAGYVAEARPAPQGRGDDLFISAVPGLNLFWAGSNARYNATYTLTGALHSATGASEIANRAQIGMNYELGRATILLLSGSIAQTTVSNLLISDPSSSSNVVLYPGLASRFVSATVVEAISHQLTPNVLLTQGADINAFTSLAPTPPLDSAIFAVGGALERLWRSDALGVDTRTTYSILRSFPPTPDQQFISITAGPRWRHDWSTLVSSQISGGATLLLNPEPGSPPAWLPAGLASVQYGFAEGSTISLNGGTGVVPTPLTGQLTQRHYGNISLGTPISERHRVYLGSSIGYQWSKLIDRTPGAVNQTFDTFMADTNLTWLVTDLMQVFARYQFIAQLGDVNAVGFNPSFVRDTFLVGLQLSSRPQFVTGGVVSPFPGGGVMTQPPRRVDGGDAPQTSSQGSDQDRRELERREVAPAGTTGTEESNTPNGIGGSRWNRTAPNSPPEPEPEQPAKPRQR